MKHEKSCGAIIIEDGKALLIHQQNGLWGFPKGHVEPGETELETAEREVEEEVGLDIILDKTKRIEFSYDIKDSNVHKTVVLFLARLNPENTPASVRRQEEEVAETRWVPLAEVEDLLTYPEWKEAWRRRSE